MKFICSHENFLIIYKQKEGCTIIHYPSQLLRVIAFWSRVLSITKRSRNRKDIKVILLSHEIWIIVETEKGPIRSKNILSFFKNTIMLNSQPPKLNDQAQTDENKTFFTFNFFNGYFCFSDMKVTKMASKNQNFNQNQN